MARGRRGEIIEDPTPSGAIPRAFPPDVKKKRVGRHARRRLAREHSPAPRRVRGALKPMRVKVEDVGKGYKRIKLKRAGLGSGVTPATFRPDELEIT